MTKRKKLQVKRPLAKEEAEMEKEKQEETKNLPVNRFLNDMTKKGKLKYSMADKVRKYILANPDPAEDKMRMCNALLHEIRFHKDRSEFYLQEHIKAINGDTTDIKDQHGRTMTPEQLYLQYVAEKQATWTTLSRLRQNVGKLLETCSEEVFSLEMYNSFVESLERVVKELGFDLFPTKATVINPL